MLAQAAPKNEHACRPNCAACCIIPSISSTTALMPHGKPAGQTCPHLNAKLLCNLFGQAQRPKVCENFKFDAQVCGTCKSQAETNLIWLEEVTS